MKPTTTDVVKKKALKNRPDSHGTCFTEHISQTVPMTTARHFLIALPCCLALFSLIIFSIKDAFFGSRSCSVCVCVCVREKPWIARSVIHNCHVTLGLMAETCLQQRSRTHTQAELQTVQATTTATLRRAHTHTYIYTHSLNRLSVFL